MSQQLAELITPTLISAPMKHASQDGVFRCLLDLLQAEGVFDEREYTEIYQNVVQRETQAPTGFGFGIGVPHARCESLNEARMAIAICPDGVSDYKAMDGQPIHIVAMVLSPASNPQAHAQIMQILFGKLQAPAIRQALCDTDNAINAYKILSL